MQLEDSIIQQLPQIPYIIDQVGEALDWAKEVLNEGEYNRMLKLTYDVVMFTQSVSNQHFFKVQYVVATILSTIKNAKEDERFAKFKSASNAVEEALDAIAVNPKDIEEKGCFKSIMLHLIPLAKENMELFAIGLLGIKHNLLDVVEGFKKVDVKSPITGKDYIIVLGYALVMSNIRMANIHMTNEAHKIYNEISIMLNKDLTY